MSLRFEGKVAVVTGVNNKGIGGAIAERLAEEGAAVVCLWFGERPVRLLGRFQKKDYPCLDVECDVTSPASVRSGIDAAMSEFGQIDVLVNNAGVEISKELEETSDTEWDALVDVNLTGAMRVIRTALPLLTERDGVIVNLASVLGLAGCHGFPAYSATKAGLIGLTQSLAMELAPRGIRAVCVAPALVYTPMIGKYLLQMTDDVQSRIEAAHPLGVGSPQDVANAVAFLASREAKWITGVTLPLGWAASFQLPMQQLMAAQPGQSFSAPPTSQTPDQWAREEPTEAPVVAD